MALNVKVRGACVALLITFLLVGCSQGLTKADSRNDSSPSPSTSALIASPMATVHSQQTPLTAPSNTPFPDDSEQRHLLSKLPDYWGDWIPDDDSVYILGVKDFGRVMFTVSRTPDEMKHHYEQKLEDSQWGDGTWEAHENGYSYILSKHNPRMKLNITITDADGTSRVDVFQEYREQDGY